MCSILQDEPHFTCNTPNSNKAMHHCLIECLALNLSPQSSGWKQASLSLSRGGLGLRSVAVHSTAAYLGSISSSSPDLVSSHYVIDAINLFNLQVSAVDTLSIPLPMQSHLQHELSQRIENCQFSALYDTSSLADRARPFRLYTCLLMATGSPLP